MPAPSMPALPPDPAARLAEQAPAALLGLLRGFEAADALGLARLDPPHILAGLVTVLLRLVVLLHAEDRGLMPGPSLTALAHRLRERSDPQPGAWATLLARFQHVHEHHGGRLFDPARHPFLLTSRITDDVVARVLAGLLVLGGEPVVYRTLDIEHIGAVHESLLDLELERAGALHLRPGGLRRRSGAHYTPRGLTAPIVRTALQPLLDRIGEHPTPAQILDLKLCDPAMGSGAFLLAAARQLGAQLRRAWHDHGLTPTIADDEDPEAHACRLVAQSCLHGVDLDDAAVDLARHSLWLVGGARHQPFTFLDHALKHGDSLVGLDHAQLAALRPDLFPHEARLVGDAVIHAHFSADADRQRQQNRESLRRSLVQPTISPALLADLERRSAELRRGARPVHPFHWHIEFPEVFTRPNPGFDCIVGNPPFLGGTRLSTVCGMAYFVWLLARNPGTHHLCDLVAHFLRVAFALLRQAGTLGFVATNTVAQGDTRIGGLAWICQHGGVLHAAQRRLRWPGSAAVVVSVVHIHKGPITTQCTLDGRPVAHISSYLLESLHEATPRRLPGAARYFSLGSKIYGQGFLFADDDPAATPLATLATLLASNPRLRARILPYIGGHEVNQSPTQSPARHAIDLSDLGTEAELLDWPELAAIVRARVKPGRDRLGQNPNNVPLKRRWWAYQAHRPSLYAAIRGLPRVLVLSRMSRSFGFTFLPPDYIYSEQLVVFTLDTFSAFATLQSRVHEIWARAFSSSMKDDLRYTPSDCFETFPFPPDWHDDPVLEATGARYYQLRAELMLRANEGLTALYNRFHDPNERSPDILELRERHAAIDRAVLTAHGWSDLAARVTCEFRLDHEDDDESTTKKKPWRHRWPQDLHDEVLARLLDLNLQRAAEEPLPGGDAR